ncbi:MAG: 50S ribosomal protein L5 [Phycisphaerae bacterium]|nr:50S ribosomal protein L5 [Phycisphaerae bacterium]
MNPRVKDKFIQEVCPKVEKEFGIGNRLALPKLEKIVLNVGMGKELEGSKLKPQIREQVLDDLAVVSGQRPIMIRAKKSVSNFKVREGWETHAKVTLRGRRMWEFFDRLVSLAIPRVKDFRGLSDRSFDRGGNYSFGVQEQAIFPEINMANASFLHGMNINFVFSRSDPQKSRFVLAELGVPFARPDQ